MAESDVSLFDLIFGKHGIAYEPGTPLSDRAWLLTETVRRRFEEAGYVVRGQNPAFPEHLQKIIEKREGKKG